MEETQATKYIKKEENRFKNRTQMYEQKKMVKEEMFTDMIQLLAVDKIFVMKCYKKNLQVCKIQ